jgi:hypothetical protein
VEKLSEKGFEHRSEREFGRISEPERSRERSVGLCCRPLRPFSDSFWKVGVLGKSLAYVEVFEAEV